MLLLMVLGEAAAGLSSTAENQPSVATEEEPRADTKPLDEGDVVHAKELVTNRENVARKKNALEGDCRTIFVFDDERNKEYVVVSSFCAQTPVEKKMKKACVLGSKR
mmetsp:Transcript_29171/g.44108  ORF Transcript_29171/g.44108 Transcript_29171/m.44108 type:complete len:107 (-) Transcript_29171:81-401(-)